jgi:hypothetical protein
MKKLFLILPIILVGCSEPCMDCKDCTTRLREGIPMTTLQTIIKENKCEGSKGIQFVEWSRSYSARGSNSEFITLTCGDRSTIKYARAI